MHDSFLMNSHQTVEGTSCQHLAPYHGPSLSIFDSPICFDEKAKLLFFLQFFLSNTVILYLCSILLTYFKRHKLLFFLKYICQMLYVGYCLMKYYSCTQKIQNREEKSREACQWYNAEQLRFCTIFQRFPVEIYLCA